MIEVEVDIDIEVLAWTLARKTSKTALIEFILHLDELCADLDFTKELHAELGEAIEKEENNG